MAIDPKTANWQDWMAAADATLKEIMEYAKGTNIGIAYVGKPQPMADDYWKTLSGKEVYQRQRAMELKRKAEAAKAAKQISALQLPQTQTLQAAPSVSPLQSLIQGGNSRLDTFENS